MMKKAVVWGFVVEVVITVWVNGNVGIWEYGNVGYGI